MNRNNSAIAENPPPEPPEYDPTKENPCESCMWRNGNACGIEAMGDLTESSDGAELRCTLHTGRGDSVEELAAVFVKVYAERWPDMPISELFADACVYVGGAGDHAWFRVRELVRGELKEWTTNQKGETKA